MRAGRPLRRRRSRHSSTHDTTGICLFTDNGDSVETLSEGLTNPYIIAPSVDSTSLYPGEFWSGGSIIMTAGGEWRRPLSQMIASVEPATSEVPRQFELHKDYPNPFNPTTTLGYGLPNKTAVQLSVFNTLGQSVSTLVNGEHGGRVS